MAFDGDKLCVDNVCEGLNGLGLAFKTITTADSPYTTLETDVILYADATAGPINVQLASFKTQLAQTFLIGKADATTNLVTVTSAVGANNIDGVGSFTLGREKEFVRLSFDTAAADWRVTSDRLERLLTGAGTLITTDGTRAVSLTAGADGSVLVADSSQPAGIKWGTGATNVVGPASATDNAVARFDATTGKIIQNSTALLGDLGALELNGASAMLQLPDIAVPANGPANTGRLYKKAGTAGLFWRPDVAGAEVDVAAQKPSVIAYTMLSLEVTMTSATFTTLGFFVWNNARYNAYTNGVFVCRVLSGPAKPVQLRLQDVTNAVTIGSISVAADGFYTFTVTNPTADAVVELQALRTGTTGADPKLYGGTIEFDLN